MGWDLAAGQSLAMPPGLTFRFRASPVQYFYQCPGQGGEHTPRNPANDTKLGGAPQGYLWRGLGGSER